MFKEVILKNFRGLKYLEIDDLQPFNLFVGRNNCGKSTILEGIFILINPFNPELILRTNLFRGIEYVDYNLWKTFFYNLETELNIELSCELIDQFKSVIEKRFLTIKPLIEKNLPSMKLDKFVRERFEEEQISSEIKIPVNGLIFDYRNFKPGLPELHIKKYISIRENRLIANIVKETKQEKEYLEHLSGSFIVPDYSAKSVSQKFHDLQIKKRIDRVLPVLRDLEPLLKSVSLGVDNLIYCDIGLENLVPLNILGNGIIKILYILSTIASTENGILLIDEIENGLYPISQELLWHAIFKTAKEFNVQIFATTHSLECIKAYHSVYHQIFGPLDEIRLFRIEKQKSSINIVKYNQKRLATTLEMGLEMR